MNVVQNRAFLRVPPFPGAKRSDLGAQQRSDLRLDDTAVDALLDLAAELRVGGDYWAKQPDLPDEPYLLLRVGDPLARSRAISEAGKGERIVCWTEGAPPPESEGVSFVTGSCDPWHLLGGASGVVVDSDDELALIAMIAGVPVNEETADRSKLRDAFRERVAGAAFRDPFTDEPMDAEGAIRLCGFWRWLIDSNRDISSAVGFAFWKRATVAPLLWGGSDLNFTSKREAKAPGKVAIWKTRTPAPLLAELERTPDKLIEVEDGFIRSAGLGADCVPPLSIVVDRLGVHFDPSKPSDLERLIEAGGFMADMLDRARQLRELIVSSGVSKYGAGQASEFSRDPARRTILVPGQVEDDRAVLCGGGGIQGNLDLLRRVRADALEAHIVYKPHPDIEAGHRLGAIDENKCLEFADEVVCDQPISALLDVVDEVHVNTSLAGFEALLRSKEVTTHGVPFYAGWGLTRDLGAVPSRRTARRSLDELVVAVLLIYPRYLDPKRGLPCPPEILVRRLVEGTTQPQDGVVVQMRRFQGRLKKRIAGLGLAR